MKPKVYIETTIISYLAAWPSRDLVMAAHQQITREWWESRRTGFELFVSQLVIEEAGRGDVDAAARRLEAVRGIPLLAEGSEIAPFAKLLVSQGILPSVAMADAVHIATASMNGMDYLLTWNCRHIANARTRDRIEEACRNEGIGAPIICTPEELP